MFQEKRKKFQTTLMESETYSKYRQNSEDEWDFLDADTQYLTHNFHPFPAKFIPQIPRKLIQKYCRPRGIIFDPFCGSGTTLVEAKLLGHTSVGVDINPLFILLSKVKTTPIQTKLLDQLNNLKKNIITDINLLYGQKHLSDKNIETSIKIPNFYNRDHWFPKHVQKELALIRKNIDRIKDVSLKNFCFICLSSIIVRVSYQDSDTRYARKERNIKPRQACQIFLEKLSDMENRIIEFGKIASNYSVKLYCHDSRHLEFLKNDSFDIVITSPPYLNAYDYHKYHRQRLNWLGIDPTPIRKAEIGGHDRYSRKGAEPSPYFENMSMCINEMHRLLKPNSYCFIVIGDAIVNKKPVSTHSKLTELGMEIGFDLEKIITRKIDLGSKYFGHGSRIEKEYIIMMKKH